MNDSKVINVGTSPKQISKRLITLLAVAFGVFVIWRVEVEIRGWNGLEWIRYFHVAIPFGLALFLGWLRFWGLPVTPSKNKILLATSGWLILGGLVLEHFVTLFFITGPNAMMFLLVYGETFFNYRVWHCPLVWVLFPMGLYLTLSRYLILERWSILVGVLIWFFSWHLGLLMITVLPEKGSSDLIHSLKTGWMIPFCVFGLGFPFFNSKTKKIDLD